MLRALFRRLTKWKLSRNVIRSSGYELSPAQAEAIADSYLEELLQIDVNNCSNKNPSVIKRETIYIDVLSKSFAGWHCYKSSNGHVYVYMLETEERIIMP